MALLFVSKKRVEQNTFSESCVKSFDVSIYSTCQRACEFYARAKKRQNAITHRTQSPMDKIPCWLLLYVELRLVFGLHNHESIFFL